MRARGEGTHTACLVLLTQEVISFGSRTIMRTWVNHMGGWVVNAFQWEQEKPFLSLTLLDPEYPALLLFQTLMNAPSRISVSLGPARTCLACSVVPVMMATNWTEVEATAQV